MRFEAAPIEQDDRIASLQSKNPNGVAGLVAPDRDSFVREVVDVEAANGHVFMFPS